MKQLVKSYFLVGCLVALCLAAPSVLAYCYDRVALNVIETEVIEPIELGVTSGLSLSEKLILTQSGSLLDSGGEQRAMTADAVTETAAAALSTILSGMDVTVPSLTNPRVQPALLINPQDPRQSLSVWNLIFENGAQYGQLLLDDESGKLLSLNLYTYARNIYSVSDAAITDMANYDVKNKLKDKDLSSTEPFYQLAAQLVSYWGLTLGESLSTYHADYGILPLTDGETNYSVRLFYSPYSDFLYFNPTSSDSAY